LFFVKGIGDTIVLWTNSVFCCINDAFDILHPEGGEMMKIEANMAELVEFTEWANSLEAKAVLAFKFNVEVIRRTTFFGEPLLWSEYGAVLDSKDEAIRIVVGPQPYDGGFNNVDISAFVVPEEVEVLQTIIWPSGKHICAVEMVWRGQKYLVRVLRQV